MSMIEPSWMPAASAAAEACAVASFTAAAIAASRAAGSCPSIVACPTVVSPGTAPDVPQHHAGAAIPIPEDTATSGGEATVVPGIPETPTPLTG